MVGMKAVLKAKVQDFKRKLILEEASIYFESVGLEAAKMAEVAKRCGISVGALYKIFPSKDALFYAYTSYQIDQLMKILQKRTKDTEDPQEKLKLFAQLKLETFSKKAKAIRDPLSGYPLFFTKLNISHGNPAEPIYAWLTEEFKKLTPNHKEDALKNSYRFNALLLGEIEYWLLYGGELAGAANTIVTRFLYGISQKQERQ